MRGDKHYRNESEPAKARVSEDVPAETWPDDFSSRGRKGTMERASYLTHSELGEKKYKKNICKKLEQWQVKNFRFFGCQLFINYLGKF